MNLKFKANIHTTLIAPLVKRIRDAGFAIKWRVNQNLIELGFTDTRTEAQFQAEFGNDELMKEVE